MGGGKRGSLSRRRLEGEGAERRTGYFKVIVLTPAVDAEADT